ncbi:MAG: hypothetical protein AABY26_00605 [Nanoarchaeota archaeon]
MNKTICALIVALSLAGCGERKAPVESDFQGNEFLYMNGLNYYLDLDKNGKLVTMKNVASISGPECFYVPGQKALCDNVSYELSTETVDAINKVMGPYNHLRFQLEKERFEGMGK